MTSVKPMMQNIDPKKLSSYDKKVLEKIALNALSGDTDKAKMDLDQFTKDKKMDKARNIAIGLGVLGAAIIARRQIAGKITKWLGVGGDIVSGWFTKKNPNADKVVTKFLNKDIIGVDKIKKTAGKVIKNSEYLDAFANKTNNILNKVGLKKIEDVAGLGVATGIGLTVDNPVKAMADKADEASDAEKQNWDI